MRSRPKALRLLENSKGCEDALSVTKLLLGTLCDKASDNAHKILCYYPLSIALSGKGEGVIEQGIRRFWRICDNRMIRGPKDLGSKEDWRIWQAIGGLGY